MPPAALLRHRTMITKVTGKHQVTIPAKLAAELGIVTGSRLEWQRSDRAAEMRIRVLPGRRAIADALLGAGRRYLGAAETRAAASGKSA
jgi:bifunctional DNA-binding transcriptional regulator/antitoxin component of YhaV-PrlF toxin-antitoxin module